ncbi:16186_t:CDS:2, partial [Gigaspora rosea]
MNHLILQLTAFDRIVIGATHTIEVGIIGTNQEIKEETNLQKIEDLIEKKTKAQEPKSILIQNKAEIYILKEWKEAFLNKKLKPRRYPKLLELAVRHKEPQEFIDQVSKEASLKPEIFNKST